MGLFMKIKEPFIPNTTNVSKSKLIRNELDKLAVVNCRVFIFSFVLSAIYVSR
jgi:uncharacterized membrane protein (DUF485 family)